MCGRGPLTRVHRYPPPQKKKIQPLRHRCSCSPYLNYFKVPPVSDIACPPLKIVFIPPPKKKKHFGIIFTEIYVNFFKTS